MGWKFGCERKIVKNGFKVLVWVIGKIDLLFIKIGKIEERVVCVGEGNFGVVLDILSVRCLLEI